MNYLQPYIQGLFLLATLTFSSVSKGQNENRIAYYDAVTISKLYENNAAGIPLDNEIWEILQFYFPNKANINSDIANNPFLKDYFKASGNASVSDINQIQKGLQETSISTGGLNVTNITDGLAKFLVERTKQELSITFFQKFKGVLDNPNYADFKTLFPETYNTLEVIDKEVYQFSHYINTLRETFEKDLQNILTTLEPFLKTKKVNRYAAAPNDPVARKIEYFESALLIINNIRQGVHPAGAVGKLEFESYHPNNTPLLQIQEGVKLFTIFSNSLRSTDVNRYWIDSNDLKELLGTNNFRIYLGLLYQLHKNDMINGRSFSFYLDQVADTTFSIDNYKKFVKGFIRDSEQIALAIQDIKQKKAAGEDIRSYKELFQSTLGFLKNLKQVDDLNIGVDITSSDKVWEVLDLLNTIYLDINERKYNTLILDLSALLTELLGAANFAWKDELIKYGTFVANVAQAENSDEVKSAIEAVALPVGSASIKKRSKTNIALNSYVGLAGGVQFNGDSQVYNFMGVNAPIGVTISGSHKGFFTKDATKDTDASSSLFITLLDIGAVTSFRFGNNEVEELPEIKLENVFTPGLYYVYGFPRAPISFGLGGQLGPQLRGLTEDGTDLGSNLSFSFRAFIAVDIPLLNFYTKSR